MMSPATMWPETWGSVGSTIVSIIFFWEMIRRYCPKELSSYLDKCTSNMSKFFNPYVEISIHENHGSNFRTHDAYAIIETYLSVNLWKNARKLKAEKERESDDTLMLSMDENEKTTDDYRGVKVQWISGKQDPPSQSSSHHRESDNRFYKLKFHRRYMNVVTEAYLKHVMKSGKKIQMQKRQRKLYTNFQDGSHWRHVVFEHPATFDTLAMKPEKKREIIEDLRRFTRRKEFYAKIGKAWKRGYLLYGPPGTGKSTMIAAMANLLKYDVYDLELTSVSDNTNLKKLLMETKSKSIIVIEDIDCSLKLTGQRTELEKPEEEDKGGVKKATGKGKEESGSKVTLSGLLNIIDGLWSACSEQRLVVFTTNFVDKLDPALTRRGRMDKHIEMSYCKYEGFKVLARNYLDIEVHPLFEKVEELIEEVEITPADVAENLMDKSEESNPEQCLLSLIDALEEAKKKKNTDTAKEKERETEKSNIASPE